MQITLHLPDNLSLTEADLRREVAIALFQQKILLIEQAAEMMAMDVDDFYQLLVDREILIPPSDPDDDPNELILAHLRISLQQAKEGYSALEFVLSGAADDISSKSNQQCSIAS